MSKQPSPLPATPTGWQLSRLRHEDSDVIVELSYHNNALSLYLENSKTAMEHPCKDLSDAKHKVSQFYGEPRTEKIFAHWHEISYRRSVE